MTMWHEIAGDGNAGNAMLVILFVS